MSIRSDIAHSITTVAYAKVDPPSPYTGGAPDREAPLQRSDAAINEAFAELLALFDSKVKRVYSVCGIWQEFFLIDRGWYNNRTDLMLTGRTLAGAPSPKERQVEGQCGCSIKERVLNYTRDVCAEASKLGVTATAYNSGAAPNRYEFAPAYEKSGLAIDHNLLLMDIMKKVALRHKLVCLLNEKPFAGVDGCGKRVGWALLDDNDDNLFNPGGTAEENLIFLTLVASVIHAVHRHGDLLRAAAASAGNDRRLGVDEAPPAIISVSLGEQLTKIIAAIEAGKTEKGKKRDLADLGVCPLPKLTRDATDRGRASPFAFTGTGFEFGMPGGSIDASTVVTVINAIVADSMKTICERIKKELGKGKGDKHAAAAATAVGGGAAKGADDADAGNGDSQRHGDADPRKQETAAAVINVLAAAIKESKPVLFEGDNRSNEWAKEAQARGLPSAVSAHEAIKAFIAPKAVELFGRHKVYSEAELTALYNARIDQYVQTLDVEIGTLTDIVNTQVLPAAYNYQADIASGLEVLRVLADDMTIEMTDGALEDRKEMFEKLTADIYYVRKNLKELAAMADKSRGMAAGERTAYLFKEINPQMDHIRRHVDALESCMPDEAWPLPKYKEMLFIL